MSRQRRAPQLGGLGGWQGAQPVLGELAGFDLEDGSPEVVARENELLNGEVLGPEGRPVPRYVALCMAISLRAEIVRGMREADEQRELAERAYSLQQIESAVRATEDALGLAYDPARSNPWSPDERLYRWADAAETYMLFRPHPRVPGMWRQVAIEQPEAYAPTADELAQEQEEQAELEQLRAEQAALEQPDPAGGVVVVTHDGEEVTRIAHASEGLSEKRGKLIRLQEHNAGAEGEYGDLPASEDTASSEAPAPSSATPPGEAPAEDLEELAPDHDPGPAHEPEAGNPGGAGEDPGWDDEVLGIALGQTPAQEPQAVARGSQAPVNQEPDIAGAGERAARETLRLAIEEERATLRERAAGLLDSQQRERALRAIDAADTVEQLELTGKRLQASLRSQAAASASAPAAPAAPPPMPEPAPEPPAAAAPAPEPPELPFGESTWEVIYKEAARRGWEGSPGCCSCLRTVAFNDLAKEAWVGGAHLVAHDTCLEKEVRRAREERNKPPPGPGCSTCGAAQPAAHVRHEGACWDACRLCLTRRATVRAGREATAVCETCRADKRFRRIKVWTPIVEPAVTPAEAAAELGEIPPEEAPLPERGTRLRQLLESHGPDL